MNQSFIEVKLKRNFLLINKEIMIQVLNFRYSQKLIGEVYEK